MGTKFYGDKNYLFRPSTISIRKVANQTTLIPPTALIDDWRCKSKANLFIRFYCEIIGKTATPKLFKMKILAFVLQIDLYCWTLILNCIVRILLTPLCCSWGEILYKPTYELSSCHNECSEGVVLSHCGWQQCSIAGCKKTGGLFLVPLNDFCNNWIPPPLVCH